MKSLVSILTCCHKQGNVIENNSVFEKTNVYIHQVEISELRNPHWNTKKQEAASAGKEEKTQKRRKKHEENKIIQTNHFAVPLYDADCGYGIHYNRMRRQTKGQ